MLVAGFEAARQEPSPYRILVQSRANTTETLKGFRLLKNVREAATLSGLVPMMDRPPRVARASQPWAGGRNAVRGRVHPLFGERLDALIEEANKELTA